MMMPDMRCNLTKILVSPNLLSVIINVGLSKLLSHLLTRCPLQVVQLSMAIIKGVRHSQLFIFQPAVYCCE